MNQLIYYTHGEIKDWINENIDLKLEKTEILKMTMTHFKGRPSPLIVDNIISDLKGEQ